MRRIDDARDRKNGRYSRSTDCHHRPHYADGGRQSHRSRRVHPSSCRRSRIGNRDRQGRPKRTYTSRFQGYANRDNRADHFRKVMSAGLYVVTNNPQAIEKKQEKAQCIQVQGSPLDVFDRIEELLQAGYSLVSAPLPPSVFLMRSPYRSVLVETSQRRYDAEGLLSVSAARKCLTTQRAAAKNTGGTDEDFATIDLTLLERALADCGK